MDRDTRSRKILGELKRRTREKEVKKNRDLNEWYDFRKDEIAEDMIAVSASLILKKVKEPHYLKNWEFDDIYPHPLTMYIPEMDAYEFEALKDSIRVEGQHTPIMTYEGQIIDGRMRYRACKELGIEPLMEEWKGNFSGILNYIFGQALHRRHLNQSQKAVLALDFLPYFSALAQTRKGGRPKKKPPELIQEVFEEDLFQRGEASVLIGEFVGVNPRYIYKAAKIAKKDEKLLNVIREGKFFIPFIEKFLVELPEDIQREFYQRLLDGDKKSIPEIKAALAKVEEKKRMEEAINKRRGFGEYKAIRVAYSELKRWEETWRPVAFRGRGLFLEKFRDVLEAIRLLKPPEPYKSKRRKR